MNKIITVQFLFYSLMLFNLRVNAEDIESLKQKDVQKMYSQLQTEIVLKCTENYPLSPEDTELFIKQQMPDSENAKCLKACAYKLSGMMDDQGKLSVEGVNEVARKFFSEDPERQEQAKVFAEACLSVNDVEVSDGDKGCERAALMFKCGVEKAPKFYFY